MDHYKDGGKLPEDHEDQLQLGIRIVTSSFQNKVNSLEQELRGVRMQYDEAKTNTIALQKKNSNLEHELVESHQRCQQLSDENKELFKTVGALRKQIGRLDALRSAVMCSIQEDQEKANEMGDSRALMSDEYLKSATPLTSRELGYNPGDGHGSAGRYGGGSAPAIGGMNSFSDNYSRMAEPAPQMQAAPAPAPPKSPKSPVVDGKAFFRQARSQLSYEAFNLFLASIKRLNSQQQTREETLDEARRIFGSELGDLYRDFESLLNRNGL